MRVEGLEPPLAKDRDFEAEELKSENVDNEGW